MSRRCQRFVVRQVPQDRQEFGDEDTDTLCCLELSVCVCCRCACARVRVCAWCEGIVEHWTNGRVDQSIGEAMDGSWDDYKRWCHVTVVVFRERKY